MWRMGVTFGVSIVRAACSCGALRASGRHPRSRPSLDLRAPTPRPPATTAPALGGWPSPQARGVARWAVTNGAAARSWLLHDRSTPTARLGSPNRKGPPHAAHHRSRPRRVRRVGELGRRHRSARERRVTPWSPPPTRLRGLAVRRRRRQRPRPLRSRDRSCSSAHSYGGAVITNVDRRRRRHRRARLRRGLRAGARRELLQLAGKFPGSTLGDAVQPVARGDGTPTSPSRRTASTSSSARTSPAAQAAAWPSRSGRSRRRRCVEPSGERPLWKELPSWFVFGEQDRNIPAAAPALHGRARARPPHDRDPGRLARGGRRASRRDGAPDPRRRVAARRRLTSPRRDRRLTSLRRCTDPLALDPFSPIAISPIADSSSTTEPLGLEPLAPLSAGARPISEASRPAPPSARRATSGQLVPGLAIRRPTDPDASQLRIRDRSSRHDYLRCGGRDAR